MISKVIFLSFFVLSVVSVFAQNLPNEEVIKNRLLKPYNNFFESDREVIYTQFNKSRYITGDDIWFTSWILNPLNKRLSFSTKKLYVELWSGEKKLISRKILSELGGTASNFIHIDDSLSPGTYCFRVYTNWMRNFYDEKEFNTSITILGPTGKNITNNNSALKENNDEVVKLKEQSKPELKKDYDIQFLPESGHFIEGIDNVIGVKVTDSYGRGVSVKGKVVNSINNEMIRFATNQFGMDKFTIGNASNQTFRAIIKLPDGSTREVKLPKTENHGVAINMNVYLPDVILVQLQINKLERSLNQPYILMIHANGVTYFTYQVDFTTSSSVQLEINKKNLGNDIIYATLFNEDFTPVAERVFYNQNGSLLGNISLTTKMLTNDTVRLTVKASDSLSKAKITKFSLSVLPEGTLMNNFSSSLLAESRLRPALKGDIENPGYYFEKNDVEHLVALDNLLIIQGWRKYDWPEITKNIKKQYVYPAEMDFTINGIVKNMLKNKPEFNSRVSLISPQNKLLMNAPVDSLGQFHFTKLFLVDSSNVIVSASSIKGANWNRKVEMSIPEAQLNAPDFTQIQTPPEKDEIDEDIPKMTKGAILLREVVITAKKKDPFVDKMYVGLNSRKLELTEKIYAQYHDIRPVLESYFNVTFVLDDKTGKLNIDMRRGRFQKGIVSPVMMIDEVRIPDADTFLDILRSYPMNMLEAVAVDKAGVGLGLGREGYIAITIRKTMLVESKTDTINIKQLLVKGYSAPKEYFEPKYLIRPDEPGFSKYASIYWKPDLVADSTGVASFNFKVSKPLKSVVIRAEGISFDGLIFKHEEKIVLPERE